jgi:hypothetical protein
MERDGARSVVDRFFEEGGRVEEFREDFRCGFVSIIGAPNMVRISKRDLGCRHHFLQF